jgi:hypothetical protein
MNFPRCHAALRVLALLVSLPLLSACENSASSMLVEGKDHALVLVREQPYFWSAEIRQFIVVSRLPNCQRRVRIHPGTEKMAPMPVYEAGDLLWALHQGGRWYLASTEECQVQDWDNGSGQSPGPIVGSFEQRDGKTVFVPIPKTPPAPGT